MMIKKSKQQTPNRPPSGELAFLPEAVIRRCNSNPAVLLRDRVSLSHFLRSTNSAVRILGAKLNAYALSQLIYTTGSLTFLAFQVGVRYATGGFGGPADGSVAVEAVVVANGTTNLTRCGC